MTDPISKAEYRRRMRQLTAQINLMEKQKALQALEADQRDHLTKRLEELDRESPEGKARLARERAEKEEARASARAREEAREEASSDASLKKAWWDIEKEQRDLGRLDRAEEREAGKLEREEQREIEALKRERDKRDREEAAERIEAQLAKVRVGKLGFAKPKADFDPAVPREFSTGTSPYDLTGVDYTLREGVDFFSLTEEEAEDLYGRIGASRGVVFDPSQEDVFQLGFRPVLSGPTTRSALEDELRERAARLSDELGRLRAEETLLARDIAHWAAAPAPGGEAARVPAEALGDLLKEAVAGKERLVAALGAPESGPRTRYEAILRERIDRIDAEDAAIVIAPPPEAPVEAGIPAASGRLRAEIMANLDRLDAIVRQGGSGPSRGALIGHVERVRAKVAEVEKLERRLVRRAEREADEARRHLLRRKRDALETALERAWKAEELARVRAEALGQPADAAPARAETARLRAALVEVDDQWAAIETRLRARTGGAEEKLDGVERLAELRAAVEAAFETEVEARVATLGEAISDQTKEWVEALHSLLPTPSTLDADETAPELDGRAGEALAVLAAQRAALEARLAEVSDAPRMPEIGALRAGLAALELEWRAALAERGLGATRPLDPALARAEARDIVRRDIARLLRDAVRARPARSSERESQIRAEIARAEDWCAELDAAKRLAEVGSDRLRLRRREVEEARAKLDAVGRALGDLLRARQAEGTEQATEPARVYARKPELDANFENKFTSSEIEAKAISSGIDTTDFRVSAAFTSAFVSGGGGWGRSTEESRMRGTASSGRKVYITSSFSLPKVELALPLERPCASDEFIAAIRSVTAAPVDRDERLLRVLKEFGHFVARRLTVGGKLYSTEERELKTSETAAEEAKKHANEVQTSISVTTPWFGGGAEAKGAWASSQLDKESQKSVQEAQSMILNAVGGEGGYVKDLGKWADSLQSYTRWQTIGMSDLCPSISVLPDEERRACFDILSDFVRRNQRTLAARRSARFLFYSGYAEQVGLRPTYFYLRNLAQGKVLSVSASADAEGVFAVTAAPVRSDGGQLWTISPDGYLMGETRRDGFELALTVTRTGAAMSVVAVPPDPANDLQLWRVPHRGPVIGGAGGGAGGEANRLVLRASQSGAVDAVSMGETATLTAYHQWAVVSEEAMNRLARRARVVYRSRGQVIELSLDTNGAWSFVSLTETLAAPKATGRPFAFMSGFDGVHRVVYADERGGTQQLWLPPDRPWTRTALSEITDGTLAAGDPFGYVTGATARILVRSHAGYIREFYTSPGEVWRCADLTNSGVKAQGDPFALVARGTATVLFCDEADEIREFRLTDAWRGRDLTEALPGKPKAAGDLFGYVAGSSAKVVFRNAADQLREVYNTASGGWWGGDYTLASDLGGDPVGLASGDADAEARVFYRDKAGHLRLLTLTDKWANTDLTAEAGAPAIVGRPTAFVTPDKVTHVLYRDGAGHIQKLSLRKSGTPWEVTDLSRTLGLTEEPAESDPVGYSVQT